MNRNPIMTSNISDIRVKTADVCAHQLSARSSVRQHSNNFTTVISLSITPVWTCPTVHHTSRESPTCTTPARTLPLTLKEPNVSCLVFKCGVDVAGNPSPVTGRQRRVAALQLAVPDPPNVARPEEEQLSSDHGDGIKVRLAGIGLETRKRTCSSC